MGAGPVFAVPLTECRFFTRGRGLVAQSPERAGQIYVDVTGTGANLKSLLERLHRIGQSAGTLSIHSHFDIYRTFVAGEVQSAPQGAVGIWEAMIVRVYLSEIVPVRVGIRILLHGHFGVARGLRVLML